MKITFRHDWDFSGKWLSFKLLGIEIDRDSITGTTDVIFSLFGLSLVVYWVHDREALDELNRIAMDSTKKELDRMLNEAKVSDGRDRMGPKPGLVQPNVGSE